MPPPDHKASLREVQRAFATAVLATELPPDVSWSLVGPAAVPVADRVAVYRNNAWQFFLAALTATYPVVQRRVGVEYFCQLVRDYRTDHPSRHGDLHWAGEAFPAWLAQHLDGSDYAWLADLARLEWACEQAATTADAPALSIATIATLEPTLLETVQLGFQPSLQLIASPYPIWSVWQANQSDAATPIDLAGGAEACAIACVDARVAVYRLAAADFMLLDELLRGAALGAAVVACALDAEDVTRLLRWAFAEQLVVAVNPSDRV